MSSKSIFYKDSGTSTLGGMLGLHVRSEMYKIFMQAFNPKSNDLILDVGVTIDDTVEASNYFEKMYPYKDKIVCVGIEDASHLEVLYPGIKFYQVKPDSTLPFNDNEFDIAFSNAVIEHAGNTQAQKRFVNEIIRVSKAFFITTPNRWFPVEFHTVLPLLHWLPRNIHRKIIKTLGDKFWSEEDNLNLLSKNDFLSLFPDNINPNIYRVRLLGWSSNLIALGKKSDSEVLDS